MPRSTGESRRGLRSLAADLGGTPAEIAVQIRLALKGGGSAEHASGVQWFFKDEIKSHGWYTADSAAGGAAAAGAKFCASMISIFW